MDYIVFIVLNVLFICVFLVFPLAKLLWQNVLCIRIYVSTLLIQCIYKYYITHNVRNTERLTRWITNNNVSNITTLLSYRTVLRCRSVNFSTTLGLMQTGLLYRYNFGSNCHRKREMNGSYWRMNLSIWLDSSRVNQT